MLGKHDAVDMDLLRSIHSIISQISEVVFHCQIANGFTEDYMEGIQPTWFSISYQAILGYRTIRALDVHSVLPEINFDRVFDLCNTMVQRYRLPGR